MKKHLKRIFGVFRKKKQAKKGDIVKAHDQINHLIEVIHYPDHPKRHESDEYRKNRKKLLEDGAKCFIDNGYCEGQLEIHHNVIEWAAANEADWEKVKKDHGFDHVDDIKNLLPLCHKHHQGIGTGIHKISYPAWILQKYMKPDALEAFEKAVQRLKDHGHEEHVVNHAAKKMLLNPDKAKEILKQLDEEVAASHEEKYSK